MVGEERQVLLGAYEPGCVCVCVCVEVIKDLEKEELPPHMIRVMPSEIKRVHMHVS